MSCQPGSPFDSIESAHEFLNLLREVVAEARGAIDGEAEAGVGSYSPRRLDALRVAGYNLEKLDTHLDKAVRILNDLRSLRRLLFAERTTAAAAGPVVNPAEETPSVALPASLPQPVPGVPAKRKGAVAA